MMHTASPSSERAKARWAILRSALLTKSSNKQEKKEGKVQKEDQQRGQLKNENTPFSSNNSNFSIHRFPGFQLLKCRIIPSPMIVGTNPVLSSDTDVINNSNFTCTQEEGKVFDFVEYEIEIPSLSTSRISPATLRIRTRERRRPRRNQENEKTKFNLHELMSHVHHGVDNTGNTRVWDSASTLTYLIFSGSFSGASSTVKSTSSVIDGFLPSLSSKDAARSSEYSFVGLHQIFSLSRYDSVFGTTSTKREKRLKVVELGAGMAGLASLALAALGKMDRSPASRSTTTATTSLPQDETEEIPMIDVTITDGHPDAVQNNELCAALTSAIYEEEGSYTMNTTTTNNMPLIRPKMSVQSHRLLWKATQEGAEECQALLNKCANHLGDGTTIQFDLGLVSDCTHFVEFHAALTATVGRLLRVGGICVFCQPCRGKSLQMFLDTVHAVNDNKDTREDECNSGALFDLKLYDQYDDKVLQMHSEHLAHNSYQDGCYDPNIHYSILLVMQKLREYDEERDTEAALDHIRSRNH